MSDREAYERLYGNLVNCIPHYNPLIKVISYYSPEKGLTYKILGVDL